MASLSHPHPHTYAHDSPHLSHPLHIDTVLCEQSALDCDVPGEVEVLWDTSYTQGAAANCRCCTITGVGGASDVRGPGRRPMTTAGTVGNGCCCSSKLCRLTGHS
jgi:hypothetical protein